MHGEQSASHDQSDSNFTSTYRCHQSHTLHTEISGMLWLVRCETNCSEEAHTALPMANSSRRLCASVCWSLLAGWVVSQPNKNSHSPSAPGSNEVDLTRSTTGFCPRRTSSPCVPLRMGTTTAPTHPRSPACMAPGCAGDRRPGPPHFRNANHQLKRDWWTCPDVTRFPPSCI
jgi:hypothetical protein